MGNRMVVILLAILICTALAVGQAQAHTDLAQWQAFSFEVETSAHRPCDIAVPECGLLYRSGSLCHCSR